MYELLYSKILDYQSLVTIIALN